MGRQMLLFGRSLRERGFSKPWYWESLVPENFSVKNVQFSKDSNCSRFDFLVLQWNPAKKLYHRLGAQNLTNKEGWELYRLEKDDIDALTK